MCKYFKIFLTNFFLLVIFLANACDFGSLKSSELLITKNDNEQTFEISTGDRITIELESNPSTGFRWEHYNPDGSHLYKDGETVFWQDSSCSTLVGCGGVERLFFKASLAGSGVIRLVYIGPSGEHAEYFTIYVNTF